MLTICGWDAAQPNIVSGTLLSQFQLPGAARDFFSQSTFSADSFAASYSPCVQKHALTHLCTLKIPSMGSHAIPWTHKTTAHWVESEGATQAAGEIENGHTRNLSPKNYLHNKMNAKEEEVIYFSDQMNVRLIMFSSI